MRGVDGAVFESLSDHGSDSPDDLGEWLAVMSDSGDVGLQSSVAFRPSRPFGGGMLMERGGIRSLRGCREAEEAFWLGVGGAEHGGWLDYVDMIAKKKANNDALRTARGFVKPDLTVQSYQMM